MNVAAVKSGKEKKPSFVVVVVLTNPFPSPVTVTETPGNTDPEASWTLPDKVLDVF